MQPGRTFYETVVSTEEGDVQTQFISSISTIFISTCSDLVAPATPASTVTKFLPGSTLTSILTAPGSPGSERTVTEYQTKFMSGSPSVITAPGEDKTFTKYETKFLPGSTVTARAEGSVVTQYSTLYETKFMSGAGSDRTTTEYETKFLPGSTVTKDQEGPTVTHFATKEGGASVLTKVETETRYETKEIQMTHTAEASCAAPATVTITSWSDGGAKPSAYEPHSGVTGGWDNKPADYGMPAATAPTNTPMDAAPNDAAPAKASADAAPVDVAPVDAAPVDAAPAKAPVDAAPSNAPVEVAPVDAAPAKGPEDAAPVDAAPVADAPDDASVAAAPADASQSSWGNKGSNYGDQAAAPAGKSGGHWRRLF